MSTLAERLASFGRHAAAGGVRVNIHTSELDAVDRQSFADKVVLYACMVGAGVALTAGDPYKQPFPSQRVATGSVTTAAERDGQHFARLREQMRWVEVSIRGETFRTPDLPSRLLLAKSAAEHADLDSVGLSHKDVYGLIHAETSWVPRSGSSRNGTPNLGIAQFEPATAAALGVSDPEDVVEAVHAAARLMKDGAAWSIDQMAGLKLDSKQRAAKLREGVSVYYNLSSRGRRAWTVHNTRHLPKATITHIENLKRGAMMADTLEYRVLTAQSTGSRGVAAGHLAGSATAEAAATSDEPARPDVQLSSHPAAKVLRELVRSPCAESAASITALEYNSACVFNRRFRSHDPVALSNAFNKVPMTYIGDVDMVPVLLIDDPGFGAVSARYGAAAGNDLMDKHAIVVTTGLVQALQGPHQVSALQFVIGHELGHLKHDHVMPLEQNPVALMRIAGNEKDADFHALQFMTTQGTTLEDMQEGARQVFDRLKAETSGSPLHAITNGRQATFEAWLQDSFELREQVQQASRTRHSLHQVAGR